MGICSGSLIHTTAATLGLSAILATSALAFDVVKYAGAAYLVYLGIRSLREKVSLGNAALEPRADFNFWKIYRQGFLTNVLNPKVALFFLSYPFFRSSFPL